MPTQKRGQLTDRIKIKSQKMIGREISQVELRLILYITYVMMNEQKIDPNKINFEERLIIAKWKTEGHVVGGMTGLAITREFWDFMTEMVFLGYVEVSHGQD